MENVQDEKQNLPLLLCIKMTYGQSQTKTGLHQDAKGCWKNCLEMSALVHTELMQTDPVQSCYHLIFQRKALLSEVRACMIYQYHVSLCIPMNMFTCLACTF